MVSGPLQPVLCRLQRGHPVRDSGVLPEVQALRLERARSDAARRLRHVPGALPDRAVAAILALQLRSAGDRQGRRRICADGRVQLGLDASVAANSGFGAGVVAVITDDVYALPFI